jgi:hypothetical protein
MNIVEFESAITMLNIVVDDYEQCGQHNIGKCTSKYFMHFPNWTEMRDVSLT